MGENVWRKNRGYYEPERQAAAEREDGKGKRSRQRISDRAKE